MVPFSIFSVFALPLLAATTSLGAAAPGPVDNSIEKRDVTGTATWGYQGIGACGVKTEDTDLVTGVSGTYFDSYPGFDGGNPSNNPLCGQYLVASYNGKTIAAKITDRNDGQDEYNLVLSKAAFALLANPDEGHISPVTWFRIESN